MGYKVTCLLMVDEQFAYMVMAGVLLFGSFICKVWFCNVCFLVSLLLFLFWCFSFYFMGDTEWCCVDDLAYRFLVGDCVSY